MLRRTLSFNPTVFQPIKNREQRTFGIIFLVELGRINVLALMVNLTTEQHQSFLGNPRSTSKPGNTYPTRKNISVNSLAIVILNLNLGIPTHPRRHNRHRIFRFIVFVVTHNRLHLYIPKGGSKSRTIFNILNINEL